MASKENIFKAHWEMLVLVVGIAALGLSVVLSLGSLGLSPEAASDACAASLKAEKPTTEGVPAVETSTGVFKAALVRVKTPPLLSEVPVKEANFLASERRVFCRGVAEGTKKACGRPMPAGLEVCPFCGLKQPVLAKVEIDSDHDGLPNDYEARHGLNLNADDASADADKDGFTNLEEFQAGTNPKDAKDHPDYLDSLFAKGALRQTTLPFYLESAYAAPDGKGGSTYRATFRRTQVKNKYEDKTFANIKVGDPIETSDHKIKSGYTFVSCEKQKVKKAIKGAKGLTKTEEVAVAIVARMADGRRIKARQGERKVGVDTEATLLYRRNGEKTFTVSEGAEIELNGVTYRVVKLAVQNGKTAVKMENVKEKVQKTIMYLD